MKNYADQCVKGFPKEVMDLVISNMKDHLQTRCNDAKEKADFVENAKCFTPREKMEPLFVCTDKHIKMWELAMTMGKDDHVFGACCGYQLFKRCVVAATKQTCGEGQSQYWDDMFDEVVSPVLEISHNFFFYKKYINVLI